jgi:hypothetical protein
MPESPDITPKPDPASTAKPSGGAPTKTGRPTKATTQREEEEIAAQQKVTVSTKKVEEKKAEKTTPDIETSHKSPKAESPKPETAKPLLTPEELNEPVPQYKTAKGPKRRLTAEERKNAKEILNVLDRVQKGDHAALNELAKYRVKQLSGDLQGWSEIDLLPGNPGALNQMRIIIRISPGKIEVKLLQMH